MTELTKNFVHIDESCLQDSIDEASKFVQEVITSPSKG